MTYADEIKERKENGLMPGLSYNAAMDSLFECQERHIMEQQTDLDNAREDLENEKELTAKLKGLLDGCRESVRGLNEELIDASDNHRQLHVNFATMQKALKDFMEQIQQVEDGDRPYTGFDTELIDSFLAKAKEVMP